MHDEGWKSGKSESVYAKTKGKKIILHYYSILRSSHALDKDSIKCNSMGWVERIFTFPQKSSANWINNIQRNHQIFVGYIKV